MTNTHTSQSTKNHSTNATIGVLLTNTGTPTNPSIKAVRRYLREFLSDKRIVQLPRWLWLPLLHGVILPLRARRSAKLYKKIWQEEDSPQRLYMMQIAQALRDLHHCHVEVGMNYGKPSIAHAINQLLRQPINQLVILPLYPQFSLTTVGSTCDSVFNTLKNKKHFPALKMITSYYQHEAYIQGLQMHVEQYWAQHGRAEHLLISFHGLPKRYVAQGDPYESHCQHTATSLANALQLKRAEWTLCYQSQFGYDKWLQPSTQTLLRDLPKKGVTSIDIVCPGFAVDCLETLEEIAITGQEAFLSAGGKQLRYIPALNASTSHIRLLKSIIDDNY